MEVLLDSSFVISCIKRKIDFILELENLGFKVILPKEVYQELKDLRAKSHTEEKKAIDIALKLFEKVNVKKMSLGNIAVDKGLIEKGRDGYFIATLDTAIKRQVKNRVIISNAKNNIEIERD